MVGRVQSKQNRSKDYKTATGKDMIGRRRLLGSVGFSKGMFLTFYSFRTVFALFTISLSFFLPPKPRRGMVTKTTYVTDKGSMILCMVRKNFIEMEIDIHRVAGFCKHVGALLWYIEEQVRLGNNKTCTGKKQK